MINPVHTLQNGEYVLAVAITADGARIIAGCRNDVIVWNARSGQKFLGPLKGHSGVIWSVAVSPDGSVFASGSDDSTIRLWNTASGGAACEPLKGHTKSIGAVTFSPDGRLLVSGSTDTTIRLWHTSTGQIFGEPIQAHSTICAIAMSTDGTKFAAACVPLTIRTYDTTTRTLLFEYLGDHGFVDAFAFSPDSRFLASGSVNENIHVWDAATGNAVGNPLEGHTKPAKSVTFSLDGRYIASGSIDNTARIWVAGTGEAHGDAFSGHTGTVSAVAFTPDGRFLVSGSHDSTIMVWKVPVLRSNERLKVEITSSTSMQDIVSHLNTWGCIDMSSRLDWNTANGHPVSRGGFGDIFRCTLTHGEEVAIKALRIYADLSEQNRKSLKHTAREIYTWSKCRHPNVQPLMGLVLFRNQIGMVTAWEMNGNLTNYLNCHPEADRCQIITQVVDGLEYLHDSAVIHGDLKCANILVSKNGVAQLADFGNATLLEYTIEFSQTSSKESLSPRWAAPELFVDGHRSTQADVYALGMTILEILTGKLPWIGKNDFAVMFSVMQKQVPDRPTEIISVNLEQGDMLWQLLNTCWAFEPEKRPSAAIIRNTMTAITWAQTS